MTEAEVLIVGAGPTGLTAACALLSAGVGCRVVDAADSATTASRAIGLSARSLEILQYVGAADALIHNGVHCPGADFYVGGRRIGRIDLASRDDTRFGYMLSIPQAQIEAILERRLGELGGKVERRVELTGLDISADGCTATLLDRTNGSEESVSVEWLIGADGSHSRTRTEAAIRRETVEESNAYLIVDVLGDSAVDPRAGSYYFHPDGMALIAPLPDGSHRLAATVRDANQETTVDRVRGLFAERTAGAIEVAGLRDAGWGPQSVRVRTGIAEHMRNGRCFIAGDAVHSYGPLGGQGMNGGIQDAYALAWRLAMVVGDRAGEGVLDSYESERLCAAKLARRATGSQTRLATLQSAPLRIVRDLAVRVGTATGVLNKVFVPAVTQLGMRYKVADRRAKPGAHSGSRLPDVPMVLASGATVWTHDLIDNRVPTVLLIGDGPGPDPAELRSAVGSMPHVVRVDRDSTGSSQDAATEPDAADIAVAFDEDGNLHRRLGVTSPVAMLVRPDRYVIASRPVGKIGELDAFIVGLLGRPVLPSPTSSR